MTGATSGAATSYPAEAHELSKHLPVFSEIRVTRSLVLSVCYLDRCLSFCPFSFGHCGFFLFTDSGYPFGIFKLFLNCILFYLLNSDSVHVAIPVNVFPLLWVFLQCSTVANYSYFNL